MTATVFTLSPGSILTDPNKILPYQIRHYVSAPKSALNVTQGLAVSLAWTMANNQNKSTEELSDAIRTDLTSMFGRIFGTEAPTVTVTITPDDDAGAFTVLMSVIINYQGSNYSFTENVKVDERGQLVYEEYDPEII